MKRIELEKQSIGCLRKLWSELWCRKAPSRVGRMMLIKSIQHKQRDQKGDGLNKDQKRELNKLIVQYKNNETAFERGRILKTGTKLIREYKSKKHVVKVLENGFEYEDRQWKSLSKIANEITGSKWNGWRFFGLK